MCWRWRGCSNGCGGFEMNNVQFKGNLVRPPEIKYAASGLAIMSASIGVNTWKSKDEKETCFVDFVLFGEQGEAFAEKAEKGAFVYIAGKLKQRTWETDSGEKRHKYEVSADVAVLLPKREKKEE